MLYCMLYFTCDRSFSHGWAQVSMKHVPTYLGDDQGVFRGPCACLPLEMKKIVLILM